jgi:hypothetical protein
MDESKNKPEFAKKYDLWREVLEAFFILCFINIIHVFSSSPIRESTNFGVVTVPSLRTRMLQLPWGNIVMWSLILGAFITAMHLLDDEMYVRIKDGMKNSIGGVVISSAIARR